VPIVFVQLGLGDHIELELTDSIARPNKNATGFLNFEAGIVSKWLQVIAEIAPQTQRVGAIASHRNFASGSSGAVYFDLLKRYAQAFSFEVHLIVLKDASQIKDAIGTFAKSGGNASLVILADIFNTVNKSEIIAAVDQAGVPAIYPDGYFTKSGGLLSYGVDLTALYKGAAIYVDRILRGARVADLSIQMPSKFTLSVNLPAARRLGITISARSLMQADETIE
jgi:putative ABC transport system substrate-binding protein